MSSSFCSAPLFSTLIRVPPDTPLARNPTWSRRRPELRSRLSPNPSCCLTYPVSRPIAAAALQIAALSAPTSEHVSPPCPSSDRRGVQTGGYFKASLAEGLGVFIILLCTVGFRRQSSSTRAFTLSPGTWTKTANGPSASWRYRPALPRFYCIPHRLVFIGLCG